MHNLRHHSYPIVFCFFVLQKKYKIDSLSRVRQRLRLLTECEKLKKTMSSNANRIPLTIESFFEERDVSGSFQRFVLLRHINSINHAD